MKKRASSETEMSLCTKRQILPEEVTHRIGTSTQHKHQRSNSSHVIVEHSQSYLRWFYKLLSQISTHKITHSKHHLPSKQAGNITTRCHSYVYVCFLLNALRCNEVKQILSVFNGFQLSGKNGFGKIGVQR